MNKETPAWASISRERLATRTYELVKIPSPTGQGDAVTQRYAAMLEELGLDVTIDAHYASSPNIVARWWGTGHGPTLSFVGHLDTIHAPHASPRLTEDAVHGRGADDMKGSMAAVVEALTALRTAGITLNGNITVAAHTLHEAPVGKMEGLRRIVASGVLGDAALVAESFPREHQILAGKGQAIFTIIIRRQGEIVHENYATSGTVNPIDVAVDIAARLRARQRELAAEDALPLLGPETLFIGEIHGGDFYNRVPIEARICGIRRFGPTRTWQEIEAEFAAIVEPVIAQTSASITVELGGNGLGYIIPADAPIVEALAKAHRHVTNHDLPITGTKSVTDANIITREGGIPALCYGPNGNTAHADEEWVSTADLERAARVFVQLAIEYPGLIAA